MDGRAWWAVVHGVAKSRTRLSDFTFTFHFHALEKGMATHSSVLAWRIPGTGEPGGLQSMGSHRVGHDWSDLAVAGFPGSTSDKEPGCQCRRHKRCGFDPWVWKFPWRRAWRPPQYSCLENLYGQRSLTGCHPWGCKESDMTEATEHTCTHSLRYTYYYNIIQMLRQLCLYFAQEKNSILIFFNIADIEIF